MSKPTIKDKLEKIKKIVFATDTNEQTFVDYKLKDGTTCSVDKMEVGGAVKIGDAPAPDGTYTLEDGSAITVAAGLITAVTPVAKPAENPEELKTPEQMKAAIAKFAVPGATVDMPALVTVLGACFNYCFGWEIRQAEEKAQRDAAIATYKANFAKIEKQLTQHKDVNKQLFELVEQFANESEVKPLETPKNWDEMTPLEQRRYVRAEQEGK